jgi:hypothetical protein
MAHPRVAKISLLAYAAVHGVIFWLAKKGTLPSFAVSLSILLFGALSYFWLRLDSNANRTTPEKWLSLVVFLLPIVGVPIYLLKHRDADSRGKSFLGFFGFVILAFFLYMVGTFLADFI